MAPYPEIQTSGCEEYDFLDDIVLHFDVTGQLVGFDQKRKSLGLTGNEISANEVEKLFAEHFAECSPKRLSKFQLRACNQPAKAIIGLALEML